MNTKGITRLVAGCHLSADHLLQMKFGEIQSIVFNSMARQMAYGIAQKTEFMTEEIDHMRGGKEFRMNLIVMSEARFRELTHEFLVAGFSGRDLPSVDRLLYEIDQEQNPPAKGPDAEEVQRVAKALGVDGKDGA